MLVCTVCSHHHSYYQEIIIQCTELRSWNSISLLGSVVPKVAWNGTVESHTITRNIFFNHMDYNHVQLYQSPAPHFMDFNSAACLKQCPPTKYKTTKQKHTQLSCATLEYFSPIYLLKHLNLKFRCTCSEAQEGLIRLRVFLLSKATPFHARLGLVLPTRPSNRSISERCR